MSHDPKILERIRKLRALATSSNEHEAAVAAGRAAEMMAEHQIAEALLDVGDTLKIVTEDGSPIEPEKPWVSILARGVAVATACDVFHAGSFKSQQIHIVGRPDDVATAVYLLRMLRLEVDRLCRAAVRGWNVVKPPPCSSDWDRRPCERMENNAVRCRRCYGLIVEDKPQRADVRSYSLGWRIGCASRISERLQAQRATSMQAAPETAIVLFDRLHAAILDHIGPTEQKARKVTSSERGQRDGAAAGNRVPLSAEAGQLPTGALRLTRGES